MSGDSRMASSNTNAAELRKIKKPLIEKRRRERMNRCLEQLKDLVLDAAVHDNGRSSKMEKADILEKTVLHLKQLQQNFANNNNNQINNNNNTSINNDLKIINDSHKNRFYNTSSQDKQPNKAVSCACKHSPGETSVDENDRGERGDGGKKGDEEEERDGVIIAGRVARIFNTNSGSPGVPVQQKEKQHFQQLKCLLQQQPQTQHQIQLLQQSQLQQPPQLQLQPQSVDVFNFKKGFEDCIGKVDSYLERLGSSTRFLRSSLVKHLRLEGEGSHLGPPSPIESEMGSLSERLFFDLPDTTTETSELASKHRTKVGVKRVCDDIVNAKLKSSKKCRLVEGGVDLMNGASLKQRRLSPQTTSTIQHDKPLRLSNAQTTKKKHSKDAQEGMEDQILMLPFIQQPVTDAFQRDFNTAFQLTSFLSFWRPWNHHVS